MDGERILEAGCGAGRFTEVALGTGARVYSFDLSEAVIANHANSGTHPDLVLFQGNIYEIPFAKRSFDRVFCFGVLQHTPDVERSFRCVAEMVKPGGSLAVDVYPRTWRQCLHWKYLMRPITTRMSPERLYRLVSWYAPKLIPLATFMRKIGGKAGRRLVPIFDQSDKNLCPALQREWTVLDTYDALSAAFDQPQTDSTIRKWYDECGFVDVHFEAGQGHGVRRKQA